MCNGGECPLTRYSSDASMVEAHSDSPVSISPLRYKVSPQRWAMVFVFSLINTANGYLSITFSPVTDKFIAFYATSEAVMNWIALVYPLTTVALGLPVAILVDRLGIQSVAIASASLHLVAGVCWVTSSTELFTLRSPSLAIAIAGQTIASLAQPLCTFATTKLALEWFPSHQRSTANNIASMADPFGVLLSSALLSVIVQSPKDITKGNTLVLLLVLAEFFLTVTLVRQGLPGSPPSEAAEAALKRRKSVQGRQAILKRMWSTIKQIAVALKDVQFWIILFNYGFSQGYLTSLVPLLQQMLCTKGYSDQFAGLCGSLLVAMGIAASAIAALVADKTGNLVQQAKVSYLLAAVGCIGFAVQLWLPDQHVTLVCLMIWLGIFGLSQHSLTFELAAETTYPLPETVSTALLLISTELLTVVFVLFMQAVAPRAGGNLSATSQTTCGPAATPQDYRIPNLILCLFNLFVSLVHLFGLRATYRRREAMAYRVAQSCEPQQRPSNQRNGAPESI